MEKKYQVFVSSTYTDLIEERRAVIDAILGMEQFPVGMEMFSAANDDQWSVIQRTIDNSDYYVLILGQRYGSVINDGPSKGISYTEREFEYAVSKGVPVLTFIIDENKPVMPKDMDSDSAAQEALKNFKAKASSHHYVKWWKDKGELTTQVVTALNRAMNDQQHPRPGWVRGNEKATINNNEIDEVKQRLDRMEDAYTWHSIEMSPHDRIKVIQNNDAANVLITYSAQCKGKFTIKQNIIKENLFIEVGSFELPAEDNTRDWAKWSEAVKALKSVGYIEEVYGLGSSKTKAYTLTKNGWDYVDEFGEDSFTDLNDPNEMLGELENYIG